MQKNNATEIDGLSRTMFETKSLCSCDEVETTKHYFTECSNYNQLRNQTLLEVLLFPIKILLYGDATFSHDQNESIFNQVF